MSKISKMRKISYLLPLLAAPFTHADSEKKLAYTVSVETSLSGSPMQVGSDMLTYFKTLGASGSIGGTKASFSLKTPEDFLPAGLVFEVVLDLGRAFALNELHTKHEVSGVNGVLQQVVSHLLFPQKIALSGIPLGPLGKANCQIEAKAPACVAGIKHYVVHAVGEFGYRDIKFGVKKVFMGEGYHYRAFTTGGFPLFGFKGFHLFVKELATGVDSWMVNTSIGWYPSQLIGTAHQCRSSVEFSNGADSGFIQKVALSASSTGLHAHARIGLDHVAVTLTSRKVSLLTCAVGDSMKEFLSRPDLADWQHQLECKLSHGTDAILADSNAVDKANDLGASITYKLFPCSSCTVSLTGNLSYRAADYGLDTNPGFNIGLSLSANYTYNSACCDTPSEDDQEEEDGDEDDEDESEDDDEE